MRPDKYILDGCYTTYKGSMKNHKDVIPDGINEEIDIKCDAGSRLFKEVWSVIMRATTEDAITPWEVLGCLESTKHSFIDTFLRGNNTTETED